MSPFLRLHKDDNVLVALRAVPRGTKTNGVIVESDISLAHKVAATKISAGEPVLKYGMVIGRATVDIAAGAHVHVHNLQSQYTATYYRKEDAK